jgi:hypothetical protein
MHGWYLAPQLKKLAAQLQHEVQRLEAMPPQASFRPTAKADEMKLQILDEGINSIERGKNLFHFLTILTQE